MMEAGGVVVAVIAMVLVLAINWRALQAQNISWPSRLRMMLIWGVVILGLVLLIQMFEA